MFRQLLLVAGLVVLASEARKSYEGYKVFHVIPMEGQLGLLEKFRHHPEYDFWTSHQRVGYPTAISVSPLFAKQFENYLRKHKIAHEIKIDNMETVFAAALPKTLEPRKLDDGVSFDKYLSVDEINAYLSSLASNYPNIVSVESIGDSYEGRPINIAKISSGGDNSRPVILIDAGIHAREWLCPAQALYFINQLVENQTNSDLIAKVDWHIIPSLNPDGYQYSLDVDYYWRKTRSNTTNSECPGVDANRNFGFHWDEIGASDDPCADDYAGPQAFSEAESIALRNYVLANKDRIKLYLTFHSMATAFLYPWGFTTDLPDDWKTLDDLAHLADAAQMAAGGVNYDVGSSTNALYPAAGGSDDWAKGVAGVNLSYTVELYSDYTFWPEASHIRTLVSQFFPAIEVFGNYIAEHFS